MKKHIVCLGDSNTHGYCADPSDCADGGDRFNEAERWPCLLQSALGPDYLVYEEGLTGRTTVFDDPLEEGLSALGYLSPCLRSHAPVELLILMLGTNDVKERFGASAACIALGLERLIRKAQSEPSCWGQRGPNLLVLAPPPIGAGLETSAVAATMGRGCVEKARALSPLYRETAQRLGCHFFDAGEAGEYNKVDFMHLTRRGHAQLAGALARLVPALV